MSKQWAKNHVFFEVVFSHIRRQICCCTCFTFSIKYMYMQSQCRFIIGIDRFVNGYWILCSGNAAQGPDVDCPPPFEHWGSVRVQLYLYLPSVPAWHFIWHLYIFGRFISDRGDFALRNQLLWTSYFSFHKLCDRQCCYRSWWAEVWDPCWYQYCSAHQPYLHNYWWVDFLQLYVPFDIPWLLYFSQTTVITFIHFSAFPSELLLIQ
jgi:hypothetical protein